MNPLFVTIVAEITDFVAGKAPGSVSLFFHDWAVKLSVVRRKNAELSWPDS